MVPCVSHVYGPIPHYYFNGHWKLSDQKWLRTSSTTKINATTDQTSKKTVNSFSSLITRYLIKLQEQFSDAVEIFFFGRRWLSPPPLEKLTRTPIEVGVGLFTQRLSTIDGQLFWQPAMFSYTNLVTMFSCCCCICISNISVICLAKWNFFFFFISP